MRRVEIPKPDGAGVRLLGVPCIRDRVVQTAIKQLLEPILEPLFSEHSYGFRPGRNQAQAVEAAQKIVQTGKGYVVDIDLSKFFDRVNQDRLIGRLGKIIEDKRLLNLIGMTLRSGVMKDGVITPTITLPDDDYIGFSVAMDFCPKEDMGRLAALALIKKLDCQVRLH